MPKVFTSETQKTGELGEDIACRFLVKQGFEIIERNYTRKWGEIDIIAKKANRIYFVEVKAKSVTDVFFRQKVGDYRAEEGLHPWKLKRLSKAIQTYLSDRKVVDDWQFDVAIVLLNMETRKARVEILENIIL